MPDLVTIAETTKALRVSRSTVDRLIREGALRTVAIGRRRLVKVESVRTLVESAN